MNTDIRVELGFFDNLKTKRLEKELGAGGVMSIIKIWVWAAQFKPNGILNDMTSEDIEMITNWTGKDGALTGGLVKFGFLEVIDGGYAIHEWTEHNPYAAASTERSNAARLTRLAAIRPDIVKELSAQGITGITAEDYKRYTSKQRNVDVTLTLRQESVNVSPTPKPKPNPKPLYKEDYEETKVDDKSSTQQRQQNCPYQKIIDLYHEILPTRPKIIELTPTRKGYIRNLWQGKLSTLEKWERYFKFIEKSDLLMGRINKDGHNSKIFNLEWYTKPENFVRICEQKYHDTKGAEAQ